MVQQLDVSSMPVDHQKEVLKPLKVQTDPKSSLQEGATTSPQPPPFRRQIVWFNAIGFLILHFVGLYGLYLAFTKAKLLTAIWTVSLGVIQSEGITMGAHRLFSHKSFKAKPMLRLALVLLQTMAGQNCMYIWVRDHRQHHKYSDTDADPHNATRGFFFSHIGWLMCRKHPDVITKGKLIDMSDLEADSYVMFQKKYYKTLYFLLALSFPVAVPCLLWGETLLNSFLIAYVSRTVISLNLTWLVNSAAHKYGTRPYTKDIVPVDSQLVSMLGLGEGWHNYHHTFPWDYKAAELGQKYNFTTTLLDIFADWGWAYDLRAASPNMVQHRILKRGDGSHPMCAPATEEHEQKTVESEASPRIREINRRPGL